VPPLVLLAFPDVGAAVAPFALQCSNLGVTVIHAHSRANPLIYIRFARIRQQTGGGNAHLGVPPPDFIGNLQTQAGLQAVLTA
jgi:hypothetical protein